jgi:hypothetical protein
MDKVLALPQQQPSAVPVPALIVQQLVATTPYVPMTEGKGKAPAMPSHTSDLYTHSLSYNDDEFGTDDQGDTLYDDAHVRESLTHHQVTALLSGTSLDVPSASRSTFVQGRVMDIYPCTLTVF